MFKSLLTAMMIAMMFCFSAFAGKDPNLIDRSIKAKSTVKSRPSRPFANPTVHGAPTVVNTNHGFPTAKNELHESPETVKAKWDGFTPIRREEQRVPASANKASSAKGLKPVTGKKAPSTTKTPKKKLT